MIQSHFSCGLCNNQIPDSSIRFHCTCGHFDICGPCMTGESCLVIESHKEKHSFEYFTVSWDGRSCKGISISKGTISANSTSSSQNSPKKVVKMTHAQSTVRSLFGAPSVDVASVNMLLEDDACPACFSVLEKAGKGGKKCGSCGVYYTPCFERFKYIPKFHDPEISDEMLAASMKHNDMQKQLLRDFVCIRCYSPLVISDNGGSTRNCINCQSQFTLDTTTGLWKVVWKHNNEVDVSLVPSSSLSSLSSQLSTPSLSPFTGCTSSSSSSSSFSSSSSSSPFSTTTSSFSSSSSPVSSSSSPSFPFSSFTSSSSPVTSSSSPSFPFSSFTSSSSPVTSSSSPSFPFSSFTSSSSPVTSSSPSSFTSSSPPIASSSSPSSFSSFTSSSSSPSSISPPPFSFSPPPLASGKGGGGGRGGGKGSGLKTVMAPVTVGDKTVYIKSNLVKDFPDSLRHESITTIEGEIGTTIVAFHVTSSEAADSIIKTGFRPSEKGMLGPGIYFSRNIDECINKAQSATRNAALQCIITLDRSLVVHAPNSALDEHAVRFVGCSSIHRKQQGRNDEWVVYSKDQVVIINKQSVICVE